MWGRVESRKGKVRKEGALMPVKQFTSTPCFCLLPPAPRLQMTSLISSSLSAQVSSFVHSFNKTFNK